MIHSLSILYFHILLYKVLCKNIFRKQTILIGIDAIQKKKQAHILQK